MEINLILTAKKWQLAPQLERTRAAGGVQLVKNIPARTYLAITPAQWIVLNRFKEVHTVPQVLEAAIEDRICPALGEFYELILKAVRARILIEPDQTVEPFPAANWPVMLRPEYWRHALWIFFLGGLAAVFVLQPSLPLVGRDLAASLGLWLVAYLLGWALAASLLRGAGAEVYFRGRKICLADICMLPPREQRIVLLAPLALMAAVTGFLAWWRPTWGIFPLLGLMLQLRPIFGGAINAMIRVGADRRLSDAEQHFIFAGNRTVARRWAMLGVGLRSLRTWGEIGYSIVWTLSLAYFLGALADVPPWRLKFWATQGPQLGLAAALVRSQPDRNR